MGGRKTVTISTDPEFIEELSEYLEVLSNPLRLRILKIIEHEPMEVMEIAGRIGSTYQNTKKHLDQLVGAGLAKRSAGFSRETERGVSPVWKYSLAEGGMEALIAELGVFSSITVPPGYQEIQRRIRSIRASLTGDASPGGPLLILLQDDGRTFILSGERCMIGREDRDAPPPEGSIVLPDRYLAVTRVTRPHATITHSGGSWQIHDSGSTGGTYVNSVRLPPGESVPLSTGDVIDLSVGADAARLLFVSDE
jgi:DNA-binding transcriptional ArsR family regulator